MVRSRVETKLVMKNKDINEFLDKVFEGDCITIMEMIPAKSIDLILCDLPYGNT